LGYIIFFYLLSKGYSDHIIQVVRLTGWPRQTQLFFGFLNWIYIYSISPSNNSILVFVFSFFFSILYFNIRLFGNWTRIFFKKIASDENIWVSWIFYLFQPLTLDLLTMKLHNCFSLFFMKLSQSHDSSNRFNKLVQVNLGCLFLF